MIYAIIGLLFLLADQALKFWTVAHVELNANPGIELFPFLNVTNVKNTGLAFGLGSKIPYLRWILLGLLLAFALFIILGIAKRFLRTGLARFSGAMLLAGLLGNGVDRAVYGYVVDMLEPKIGSMTLPIFNIADCLVAVFGILFCISVLTGGIGAPEPEYDEEEEEEYERRRRAAAARRAREAREGEQPRRRPQGEQPRRRPQGEQPRRRPQGEQPRRRAESEQPRRRAEGEQPRRRNESAVRIEGEEEFARAVKEPLQPARVSARPQSVEPVVVESEATVRTVERPVAAAPKAAPVKASEPKAAPAEKPAAKPAPKASADEFDLDSILAEFK